MKFEFGCSRRLSALLLDFKMYPRLYNFFLGIFLEFFYLFYAAPRAEEQLQLEKTALTTFGRLVIFFCH